MKARAGLLFVIICFTICAGHADTGGKQVLKDLWGVHGTVTSITKFSPFEMNDVLTNSERTFAFEYIELTTPSRSKMKMIHRGFSEYLQGDEVCLLYTPIQYGNCFLKDFLNVDDPAREALPLSKIRVEADGFIEQLPQGYCLLCSDENGCIYVLSTGSNKGICSRWTDDEGIVHMRIEDAGNGIEATSSEGCGKPKGSAQCTRILIREY